MTRKVLGTIVLLLMASSAIRATGTTEPAGATAPVEIDYLGYGGTGTVNEITNHEDFVAAAILEKFNVIIKPELPAFGAPQTQVLSARIAAGDYPDWAYVTDESLYTELLEDELIVNLSPYIDSLGLPDLEAHLALPTAETLREPEGWYGIPIYFGYTVNGLYYRKDWVEKLGLSLPKDMDEYRQFLQATVDADPDGFGTTGITVFSPQSFLVRHIGTSFVGYRGWRSQGGRWDYYAIDDSYRDFLRYVQDLAEAGLIDPDAVTQQQAAAREKFSSGRAAVLYLSTANFSRIESDLKELVPGGEVGIMTPPPAGPAGALNDSRAPMRYRNLAFSAAGDEKVKGFLRVLDWLGSEEGEELALWGKEGVDYVVQQDGSRLRLPVDPPGSRLFGDLGYYLYFNHRYGTALGTRPFAEVSRFVEWAEENSVVDDVRAFSPPRYRELEAIVKEIVDRYFLEFTFNSLNIDANWESYVKEVREAGIDEMASILAAQYRR